LLWARARDDGSAAQWRVGADSVRTPDGGCVGAAGRTSIAAGSGGRVHRGGGFGAAGGFILGALVAESVWTRMTLYPFLIAFQMIPKVAIAPLFIIWLGYGISSKVAFTASITFFPVVINTIAGLRSVDGEVLEMMRVFRASRWQSFYRVKLRFAMPYIFASLEVAMVLSVIGAIVAEFVGATKGLGYLILQEMHKLDTAMVFALLTVLSVLGIILSYAIRLVARVTLFWHESERVRE
jgi:NitT/TauT family transport system permease protein